MPTINVLDAAEQIVAIEKPNANGRAAAAASRPIAFSTEDLAAVNAIATALGLTLAVRTPLVTTLASLTRPANTSNYAVNDVIGTATSGTLTFANALRTNGNSGYITKAKVMLNSTAPAGIQIRLHLFNVAPADIADRTQMALLFADESKYLGFIDFPTLVSEGTGSTTAYALWTGQMAITADAAATSVFGIMEIKNSYNTPPSGMIASVRLTVDQN